MKDEPIDRADLRECCLYEVSRQRDGDPELPEERQRIFCHHCGNPMLWRRDRWRYDVAFDMRAIPGARCALCGGDGDGPLTCLNPGKPGCWRDMQMERKQQ